MIIDLCSAVALKKTERARAIGNAALDTKKRFSVHDRTNAEVAVSIAANEGAGLENGTPVLNNPTHPTIGARAYTRPNVGQIFRLTFNRPGGTVRVSISIPPFR